MHNRGIESKAFIILSRILFFIFPVFYVKYNIELLNIYCISYFAFVVLSMVMLIFKVDR